jgi:hypothetical protein
MRGISSATRTVLPSGSKDTLRITTSRIEHECCYLLDKLTKDVVLEDVINKRQDDRLELKNHLQYVHRTKHIFIDGRCAG